MTTTTTTTIERARSSTAAHALARSGYAASGVVQGLVGVLAIQVAVQGGGQEADQSGALQTLARAPGGAVVVWFAAVGGLALALWLVADGVLAHGGDAKATWKARASSWGKAVVYGAIGVTALRVALGAGGSSSRSSRQGSAALLGLPGGPVLLAVVGLGVVVLGAALVRRGIAKRFVETIRVRPDERAGRSWCWDSSGTPPAAPRSAWSGSCSRPPRSRRTRSAPPASTVRSARSRACPSAASSSSSWAPGGSRPASTP